MLAFEFRVRMPRGGEQKIVVRANNQQNAEAMAAPQIGGKALGGRQMGTGKRAWSRDRHLLWHKYVDQLGGAYEVRIVSDGMLEHEAKSPRTTAN